MATGAFRVDEAGFNGGNLPEMWAGNPPSDAFRPRTDASLFMARSGTSLFRWIRLAKSIGGILARGNGIDNPGGADGLLSLRCLGFQFCRKRAWIRSSILVSPNQILSISITVLRGKDD